MWNREHIVATNVLRWSLGLNPGPRWGMQVIVERGLLVLWRRLLWQLRFDSLGQSFVLGIRLVLFDPIALRGAGLDLHRNGFSPVLPGPDVHIVTRGQVFANERLCRPW